MLFIVGLSLSEALSYHIISGTYFHLKLTLSVAKRHGRRASSQKQTICLLMPH